MDLDPKGEITNLNFDGENPHIAICHKSQGYSANLRHDALLFKSNKVLGSEIIKSLEGKLPEQVLVKMSYSNLRRSLEEAITAVLEVTGQYEWGWVNVYDFNDDMVGFRFQDQLWAVDYETTEEGIVTIGNDIRVTSYRELYVDSETGEELIKASLWKQEQSPEVEELSDTDGEIEGEGQDVPDSQDTPDVKENEDNMSEKIELTPEQLQEEIQKALVADRKEQEELRKAVELKTNTQELVKGFSFVEESDQEALVKSIIAEGGEVLVKALEAAGSKITSLEEELEKAGKQEQEQEITVEEEVVEQPVVKTKVTDADTAEARNKQLDQIVKARLAAKKNK